MMSNCSARPVDCQPAIRNFVRLEACNFEMQPEELTDRQFVFDDERAWP
jgi:hypothetical protein